MTIKSIEKEIFKKCKRRVSLGSIQKVVGAMSEMIYERLSSMDFDSILDTLLNNGQKRVKKK